MCDPNYLRVASILFLLVTGCSEEPGCNADYLTPKTIHELAAVNTPEALLMASVFAGWEHVREKDTENLLPSSYELRRQALRLAPNDEMVINFVSNTCGAIHPDGDDVACSLDGAMKLKNLDPENGFYWANLAHYQLSQGDASEALNSYQRAATASKFSIGWGKQVYRLSVAMKESLPVTESCASEMGAGAAAGYFPAFQEFTDTCRAHSGEEAWRKVCLDLGRKMETQGLTLGSRSMGFPLQRIVYEALGDEERLAAVAVRQKEFRVLVQEQSDLYECRWKDPEWVREWLLSIRDFDEMETMRRMSEVANDC